MAVADAMACAAFSEASGTASGGRVGFPDVDCPATNRHILRLQLRIAWSAVDWNCMDVVDALPTGEHEDSVVPSFTMTMLPAARRAVLQEHFCA